MSHHEFIKSSHKRIKRRVVHHQPPIHQSTKTFCNYTTKKPRENTIITLITRVGNQGTAVLVSTPQIDHCPDLEHCKRHRCLPQGMEHGLCRWCPRPSARLAQSWRSSQVCRNHRSLGWSSMPCKTLMIAQCWRTGSHQFQIGFLLNRTGWYI